MYNQYNQWHSESSESSQSSQHILDVSMGEKIEKLRELKRENLFQIFVSCSYPEASKRLSANELLQFDFFQNKINQNDIRFIVSHLICIYYFFIFF